MRIEQLWVVTYPTPYSELCDILFSCTISELWLHFLGGLEAGEVYGAYTEKSEAQTAAHRLLEQRDRVN